LDDARARRALEVGICVEVVNEPFDGWVYNVPARDRLGSWRILKVDLWLLVLRVSMDPSTRDFYRYKASNGADNAGATYDPDSSASPEATKHLPSRTDIAIKSAIFNLVTNAIISSSDTADCSRVVVQ